MVEKFGTKGNAEFIKKIKKSRSEDFTFYLIGQMVTTSWESQQNSLKEHYVERKQGYHLEWLYIIHGRVNVSGLLLPTWMGYVTMSLLFGYVNFGLSLILSAHHKTCSKL